MDFPYLVRSELIISIITYHGIIFLNILLSIFVCIIYRDKLNIVFKFHYLFYLLKKEQSIWNFEITLTNLYTMLMTA